jgi:hypothetical protein
MLGKLGLPNFITLALGLGGGVLQYLNQTSLHLGNPWHEYVTFGLYALAVIGVSPLVGTSFKTALNLTVKQATAITIVASLLAAWLSTVSGISHSTQGILQGVVTFLAFAGFGPASLVALSEYRGR